MSDTAPAVVNPQCLECDHDVRDHKSASHTICSICDCFNGRYPEPYEVTNVASSEPSEEDKKAIQELRYQLTGSIDEMPANEMVIHPDHYNKGAIEVWDFIRDQDLNFFLGHAVKYITRAGRKSLDHYVEDLQKAVNYIQKEIEDYKKGYNL